MIHMNDMHSLGRLIQGAMDRNEWSLRDLEERSARAGHRMSHTNFQRLRDKAVNSIKGDTVRLLAEVLKVPEHVIAAAALESMGIDITTPEHTSLTDAVHDSEEISEHDRRLLDALLAVMIGRQDDDRHDEYPEATPINAARVAERPRPVADQKKAAKRPHPNVAPDEEAHTT